MSDIDFQIVDVENELEKRREKENLEASATATGTNSGCGKMVLWFCAGLLLFRCIAEFFSLFF